MKRARGKVKSPSVEDVAPRAPVPDTPPGPGARGARGGLKLNVTTLNVTTGAAPKKKNLPGAWGPAGSVARAPPPISVALRVSSPAPSGGTGRASQAARDAEPSQDP